MPFQLHIFVRFWIYGVFTAVNKVWCQDFPLKCTKKFTQIWSDSNKNLNYSNSNSFLSFKKYLEIKVAALIIFIVRATQIFIRIWPDLCEFFVHFQGKSWHQTLFTAVKTPYIQNLTKMCSWKGRNYVNCCIWHLSYS